MKHSFLEALAHRRSNYALSDASPISDERLEEILSEVLKHTPSAFNSQSTRLVLLLGKQHKRVWEIAKEELRKILPDEAYQSSAAKIDSQFGAGYGTVLFYEDQTVVKGLQEQYPLYADNFPVWSEHANAMHQFNVWTALTEEGLGVSLQHYNPLIDAALEKEFAIPAHWTLRGEMPFGTPLAAPAEKSYAPMAERLKIFK